MVFFSIFAKYSFNLHHEVGCFAIFNSVCICLTQCIVLSCSDEEIGEGAFMCLTESLIAPLLPKIGLRALFMGKLAKLKEEVGNVHVYMNASTATKNTAHGHRSKVLHDKIESLTLSCFRCDKQFIGWHALSIHLKDHNLTTVSNYVCGQGGCQRDFQSLASFRRHILFEHSMNISQPTVDVSSHCMLNGGKNDDDNNADDVVADDFDVLADVAVDDLFDENGICLAAASFVAKLKSHSSIPSSVVDGILDDVQEFFGSQCIKLLQCKTMRVLQTQNINLNDDLVVELQHDFERLSDMFHGLKTQYQIFFNFTL